MMVIFVAHPNPLERASQVMSGNTIVLRSTAGFLLVAWPFDLKIYVGSR